MKRFWTSLAVIVGGILGVGLLAGPALAMPHHIAAFAHDGASPSSSTPATVPAAEPAPQVVAPTQRTVLSTTPPGFAGKGYAYPIVWLLPVALLAGCFWLGRLFTRSLDPVT